MSLSYRVDYDLIAHLYDEPQRDHGVDPGLSLFLSQRPAIDPRQMAVLDMGCGTGKQLAANRGRIPDASLTGMDFFLGMLKQARKRSRDVFWVQGDSASPPFSSASFDYITNQFSYPHVREKSRLVAETYRLLKPGGRFVMTNIDPWAMPGWILYRYFPAAHELDHRDFLRVERFVELMRAVGFTDIQVDRRCQNSDVDLAEFLEYASARFRASQLMAIASTDYEQGLRRIRDDIARAGGQTTLVRSDVSLVTIRGDKAVSV